MSDLKILIIEANSKGLAGIMFLIPSDLKVCHKYFDNSDKVSIDGCKEAVRDAQNYECCLKVKISGIQGLGFSYSLTQTNCI